MNFNPFQCVSNRSSVPIGGPLMPLSIQSSDLSRVTLWTRPQNAIQWITIRLKERRLKLFNTWCVHGCRCVSISFEATPPDQFWRGTTAPPFRPWNYPFRQNYTPLCTLIFALLKFVYSLINFEVASMNLCRSILPYFMKIENDITNLSWPLKYSHKAVFLVVGHQIRPNHTFDIV